jgi:thymidine kinase
VCTNEQLLNGNIVTQITEVPAPFTDKISDDATIIDIGGSDKYIAVCRKHHTISLSNITHHP